MLERAATLRRLTRSRAGRSRDLAGTMPVNEDSYIFSLMTLSKTTILKKAKYGHDKRVQVLGGSAGLRSVGLSGFAPGEGGVTEVDCCRGNCQVRAISRSRPLASACQRVWPPR